MRQKQASRLEFLANFHINIFNISNKIARVVNEKVTGTILITFYRKTERNVSAKTADTNLNTLKNKPTVKVLIR